MSCCMRSKLGGIPNSGHSELGRNRAAKTHRFVCVSVCLSARLPVNWSRHYLVTRSCRHTVNSSQESTQQSLPSVTFVFVYFIFDDSCVLFMAALYNRGPLYFCPVVSFYLLSIFYLLFSSPNLSGHRLDVYHTSTHGVALVRI